VRSRITCWARAPSFQRSGLSAAAFSSSSRRSALSQSKMPPQQGQRLLDLLSQMSDLGAHGTSGNANSGARAATRRGGV